MTEKQTTAGSTIRVVTAVIERGGRYLITQRRPNATLPLLWEFPGGKVEQGESDHEALEREVRYRLGVKIVVGHLIGFVSHPYERYTVDLRMYDCSLQSGEPHERNVSAYAWVASSDFERYEFTPADEMSMAELLGIG